MAEKEPHPSSNIVWVVLAGILGLFALGNQKPSDQSAAAPSDTESKEDNNAVHRLAEDGGGSLAPLDNFFSTRKEQKHPFTVQDPNSLALFEGERNYLIVIVPDPVDSQFGYVFDQLMDATQRALEMERFVYDRGWLPWELDKGKSLRTRIVTDWRELAAVVFPLGRAGEKKEGASNYRDENPGALLFRRNTQEDPSLLTVFLVGENTTSGVDKRALAEAIDLIRKYPPKERSAKSVGILPVTTAYKRPTIRLVGPYFTGSQTSLRMVLHDPKQRDFHFDVLSGGATGIDRDAFLKGGGDIAFQATVIPSQRVILDTLHYLARRDRSRSDDCIMRVPDKVALLTESNTSYGQSAFFNPPRSESDCVLEGVAPIELHFPLHISRLRSQYEETRLRQEEKLGLPTFDTLVPRLRTKVADRDSIPSQDPITTSSINGEVLKDILSIIRRRQIRYVGIVATDARDREMLASSVRDNCPGVQIFLISSDLLLTLPEYNYWLKGAIIGSTYPLSPQNQFWIDPVGDQKRLCFPSQAAQGYYNAILAQTGGQKYMIDYRPPLFHNITDPKEVPRRPPVWISMIGQNGDLVPLQFFTHLTTAEQKYVWPPPEAVPAAETVKKMDVAFPATDLFSLIGIVVLCLLVVLYGLSRPGPLLFWTSTARSGSLPWREQAIYRIVCVGALIFLLVPVLKLCWIANASLDWQETEDALKKVLLGFPLVVSFLLALSLFSFVPREWADRQSADAAWKVRMGWFLYGLVVLLIFGAVVSVWYDQGVGETLNSWQALYFARALDVTTGVSPLLPWLLLCLSFFFWAFFQMRRCHFAERFSVPNPYPSGPINDFNFQDIAAIDKSLRAVLLSSLAFLRRHPIDCTVVLAIVALGTFRVGMLYLPTAEGRLWSWFVFAGLALGFFLVALNLVRFLIVWSRIKKLLSEIALIPMMRAFDQLPAKIVSTFGGYLSPRRPRLSQLHIPHHQLVLLRVETERLLKKPLADEVEVHARRCKLQEILSGLTGFSAGDFGPSLQGEDEEKRVQALSERFSRVTVQLLTFLPTFWPRHSLQEAFGGDVEERSGKEKDKEKDAGKKKAPSEPTMGVFATWVRLAEDLVAIQVVIYVSQFFIQLRNLAWSMIICSTLLLLGATSYPFQPERLILLLLLVLIAVVIAEILYVLVRINQDEVVSRISRTTPNRFSLDWGFVSSLFTYVVPVGIVVALQMSGAFRFMLEPLVRVLR